MLINSANSQLRRSIDLDSALSSRPVWAVKAGAVTEEQVRTMVL